MPHIIERATSGRATCRGCGNKIANGTPRFGERLPNPYADDTAEMTHWFHPACASFRRPEAFLEALSAPPDAPELSELVDAMLEWRAAAQLGVAHHRLSRISAASLAPTGRATCRACKEMIDKGSWRIALLYYEDGRFTPSGFIHSECASEYFGTSDILDRVRHFSPDLTQAALDGLAAALAPPPA